MATREENMAKLTELRDIAETNAKLYSEAAVEGKWDDMAKAEEKVVEAANEYTATIRTMCFDECKAADDPMLHAVKTLRFMTIRAKIDKNNEAKIPVMNIEDRDMPIDLLKLFKHCEKIGADERWPHIVQKLNFLLTAQKCLELGLNPKEVNDSYLMSEIANGFDMGKNPVSKTNILKTLQLVIASMLGEGYKPTSHDVNFLMSVYAKKSRKALTISVANHRNLTAHIAEICHRIVTDKGYVVEYKTKK